MEEKIQSVQYRDSEPSEFAHKPPKQEMDLSCFPGRLSPIGRSHRFDSVELGVVHIVASITPTSGFSRNQNSLPDFAVSLQPDRGECSMTWSGRVGFRD